MNKKLEHVDSLAKAEIEAEDLRKAVDERKIELRKKIPLLDKIFPWRIKIINIRKTK